MSCTIVCGGQYGDEGKGKITAYLTVKDDIRFAVRAGVGTNRMPYIHSLQRV